MAESRTYNIGNMDCAGCAREVETGVGKLPGVQSVSVNFATGKMALTGDVPLDVLRARVEALGKTLDMSDATAAPASPPRGGVIGFWHYLRGKHDSQLALIGAALILLTLLATLLGLPASFAAPLYTLAMLITLYPIARSGLTTLWINREFNINLLMTIAAVGAIFLSEYLESATVIFLFAIGEALEGYTADRARNSIRGLMALKPALATRIFGVFEEVVPVEQLRLGDVLLVKPGEGVPMDGVLLTGITSINQAPITGESIPVAKHEGDEVYAGSLNGEGAFTLRVTRLAADNTLSRIIQLVEQAQSNRARSQRMIDRFAHYYTPAVTLMALLVAVLPPLVFGAPFLDTPTEHGWLYRALSMLVIACPCALVMSTPVTIISAITAAARRGVLVKGGVHLESLALVKAFAFDKTGTLTQGKPIVTQVRSSQCATGEPCDNCDDVLALAAAVEGRTAHPLAAAVTQAALRLDATPYVPADAVEVLPGRGVRGQVAQEQVTLGSHRYFDESFPHSADLCQLVQDAEAQGQTTMLVAQGQQVRGFLALADAVRESSKAVIAELKAAGFPTIILTGDHARVAKAVGDQIGVDDVRAGLLPHEKVAAVESLTQQYEHVAMVGDGINDTPALAAASVGIAMGGAGSPQALETADIALMADDLRQLPFAVRLARFARRLILQNIILSFGIKAIFLVLALFGVTSLWVAILADVGMSLVVTLNGMRPLRFENSRSAPV
jgi:Cd2+/Zn2+-exporting ATPase